MQDGRREKGARLGRMPLRDGDPSRIGRYRLTARLGAGGMGVVYLGNAKGVGDVAVKVLRPEIADDPEFRVRFRREVATLLRVQGVCTVRVIEADTESARPFLATEYVDGPSLVEWVGSRGPLGGDMLHGLAAGLAEALAAIHAAGVVHRDLKPGNVLLSRSGPKVIDFGIAQALGSSTVTRTGMFVGSLGFTAPEQISGRAGPPADVFAWGLTVAYAASGTPPFGTGPTEAVLYRIVHDRPDIAAVPAGLRPLVVAALARNPEERPTAPALLAHLTAAPGAPADQATRVLLSRTWLLPTRPHPPAPPVPRPGRRYLVPAAVVAALIVLVAGAVAFLPGALRHHTPPGARSRASASATPTPSASPAPSAAPSSTSVTIRTGNQRCTFDADDGNEFAAVSVTGTVCGDWQKALAQDGESWWSTDYVDPDAAATNGGTQLCALSSKGVTMDVYNFTSNAPREHTAGIAEGVCRSAEQNGWTPS